jgi:hypothetical protein
MTQDWQPIETHSGDTTEPVLVCAFDRWTQVGEASYRGDGDEGSDGWAWEGYNYRIFPTHWKPMPDPPVSASPSGDKSPMPRGQENLALINDELNALDWDPPLARSGATISADGKYRYRLWRSWANGKSLVFVMLNPSTADAREDDPTIRKCLGFAKRLGYGRLEVVNLFAWRATDPRELSKVAEPIGLENDQMILERCSAADLVIAAWGATKGVNRLVERRIREVSSLFRSAGVAPSCLGRSKDGQPRHPLMLAYDTPLELLGSGAGSSL